MTIYAAGGEEPRRQTSRARKTLAGIALAVVTAFAVAIASGAGSWAWEEIQKFLGIGGTPTATGSLTTSPTLTGSPVASPTAKRSKDTGYYSSARDYCDAFMRAWQDGYRDRVVDLSNQTAPNLIFGKPAPTHYVNDAKPLSNGAVCDILDLDRARALAIKLTVGGDVTKAHAITAVQLGA